ncbi:23S rRNA (cytosine1962-C5)-methyltransferase [Sporomusaceae bacterium BoRhaA]|uniref:class I SAM-dependent rRNA methyltransferase n=1 Tax=Pelorhabdus rhamnosifermentans TaxID=2772457 RepID=UPI001FEA1EBE|nr:class I SAM-dependent rRNA methyltransferase [Pelorhabdus rhamnosifermentans]MBU2701573.1 23S rRNA (cytosine1962-C5)-methyltransferase [Pelorhabdus rhamnosifermentans]
MGKKKKSEINEVPVMVSTDDEEGMKIPRVVLRKGGTHRVEEGHAWIFQNEIDYIDSEFEPGDIVDVYTARHVFVGRGYINPKSQIIVRILTRKAEKIDAEFFKQRILTAWNYRQQFLQEPEYCRLVYSEADFLPGLIIDKFGDIFVLQTLALGMDIHKATIVAILEELFHPIGIYERNDVSVRKLEGLPLTTGYLKGNFDPVLIVKENGFLFETNVVTGQKTGFFYDQRENRTVLKNIVQGKNVLDCFCNTGSFAIHAAKYGASHVTSIDISEEAIGLARHNAVLNQVEESCTFMVANAFDYLRSPSAKAQSYDVVILDPPAFTKSKSAIEGAIRGYKEINLQGLKLVKPGGFLITCSCSFHMDRELFRDIVLVAACDAHRTIREVEYRTQAKDHPILPAIPETHYLKFLAVQVF